MRNQWKNYFIFTRKERTAILVLLFIILGMVLVPYYLPEKPLDMELVQASIESKAETPIAENLFPTGNRPREKFHSSETFTTFPFDPNTLSEDGWRKLGIRDKTIATIRKFIERGGKFREPGDIRKIYGLTEQDAERLKPFVTISSPRKSAFERIPASNYGTASLVKPYSSGPGKIIEINGADSTDFESLPGIGYKLAARIIQFRNRLGGFHSVAQIGETYGLKDSTFQKIRRYLICDTGKIQRIDVNTASLNEMKQHPYIRWQLGKLIVEYRDQHGRFQLPEDLMKIEGIDSGTLEKLLPYLRL